MASDNRDPELVGLALTQWGERPAGVTLSHMLDARPGALAAVPGYGTVEALEMRARLNGELGRANERFASRRRLDFSDGSSASDPAA